MPALPNLFHPKPDELVLGRRGRYSFFPRFSVSDKVRRFHTYVVGLTGRGKSKFLQNCLVQDILAGHGCAVIDPHGDLAKDVLRTLVDQGYFETPGAVKNVLYVAPRRRDYVIPFNVLYRSGPEVETYEVAQRVIASFQRTWATTLAEPPRFQQIMRASLAVLVENHKTLCDLYRLLTDDDYRLRLLDSIEDPKIASDCGAFFENEFERWGRDRPMMIGSTTNKVSALTDNPSLFYMLGQSENNVDLGQIMDQGQVLLVDLGDCDHETKKLFGTLMVTGFEQSALARARRPQERRRPFYLYIDEFQDFACHPGAAETFSQMLSQVRKFGLHMILANQSIAQLDSRLQTALGNAQTIVSFRVSRADAEALAGVLGRVSTQAIKRENQTASQHPIFAPLSEQWEVFIQRLTEQPVRQVTVKTADDRFAVIWPEKTRPAKCTDTELEKIISDCLAAHGKPFAQVYKDLTQPKIQPQGLNLFSY